MPIKRCRVPPRRTVICREQITERPGMARACPARGYLIPLPIGAANSRMNSVLRTVAFEFVEDTVHLGVVEYRRRAGRQALQVAARQLFDFLR